MRRQEFLAVEQIRALTRCLCLILDMEEISCRNSRSPCCDWRPPRLMATTFAVEQGVTSANLRPPKHWLRARKLCNIPQPLLDSNPIAERAYCCACSFSAAF